MRTWSRWSTAAPRRKQEAIAGRAGVSEQVSDALVTQGSETAVATLMGNAGARITAASMGTAIDRFADSDRVKTNMVHRADLPVAVAERLVVMVSEMLQSYLVRHHELPVSLATDIVLRSRERATLHISLGSSDKELERLVRQMHHNQRLTPLLVLRALCLGDLAFFEMAMAVMAERAGGQRAHPDPRRRAERPGLAVREGRHAAAAAVRRCGSRWMSSAAPNSTAASATTNATAPA